MYVCMYVFYQPTQSCAGGHIAKSARACASGVLAGTDTARAFALDLAPYLRSRGTGPRQTNLD